MGSQDVEFAKHVHDALFDLHGGEVILFGIVKVRLRCFLLLRDLPVRGFESSLVVDGDSVCLIHIQHIILIPADYNLKSQEAAFQESPLEDVILLQGRQQEHIRYNDLSRRNLQGNEECHLRTRPCLSP